MAVLCTLPMQLLETLQVMSAYCPTGALQMVNKPRSSLFGGVEFCIDINATCPTLPSPSSICIICFHEDVWHQLGF